MIIVDLNGKKREVLSAELVSHKSQDVVNGGVAEVKHFVKVVIVGRSGRIWEEWYPLDEFQKMNPGGLGGEYNG